MKPLFQKIVVNEYTIGCAYSLLAVIVSIQAIMVGTHTDQGHTYTDYNNYIIFKQSYAHLVAGKNLYTQYPDEQWDLYKYSPAFALCMGIFGHLPDIVGLCIWNLLNALSLFFALRMLPFAKEHKTLLMWFVLPELLTCMQNAQSNGLMVALMVIAYAYMERGKTPWATLAIAISAFIKVYSGLGFCLLLLYPNKIRSIIYSSLWCLLLAVIPLVATPFDSLLLQYQNWMVMMKADQSVSYGLSVMGWLHSWFGIDRGKEIISLAGIALLAIPFLKIKQYGSSHYRLLTLTLMLVCMVIFNHKAESPTYICAVTGIGMWYFSSPTRAWKQLLMAAVLVFTSLSTSDIFPYAARHFFTAYTVKAIPCILACVAIWMQIIFYKQEQSRLVAE